MSIVEALRCSADECHPGIEKCKEAADFIEKLCREKGKAGQYKCAICGESYTESDLDDIGWLCKEYRLNGNSFICPDCWDELQRVDLSEQMKRLMRGEEE